MSEVTCLFIVLTRILISAHGIAGSQTYDGNQANLMTVSSKANESASLPVDPFLYVTMDTSVKAQQSNDKDPTHVDPGAPYIFIAGYDVNSSESYYGIQAATDVYDLSLKKNQHSGTMISIIRVKDETPQRKINAVHVGWHNDDYKTGCYNLECPGYVPEDGTSLVPGIAINSVSKPGGTKHIVVFKIFKDGIGDWLLHCGFDSEPYLIGRFPASLFTTLTDKADEVALNGYTVTPRAHLAPMGSGYLSESANAASFSNIQLIDQHGQPSRVQQNLPAVMTYPAIYSVSPISADGTFTYGGTSE
ncbi:hypothetical protein GUJ93_ZPchr0001g33116 [Zizania palustris]|uniref:Neprosin PEP catalytic domain-containing protein n=1 Tax=Zizania palustris TaxID=103762 RepID=A0A8J5SFX3_ZIZPA|nr:hypothetical protein GUJ93_ZPchr0001g33116 [Zizania palustris]